MCYSPWATESDTTAGMPNVYFMLFHNKAVVCFLICLKKKKAKKKIILN